MKNRKKRILTALLLAAVLTISLFALVACDDSDKIEIYDTEITVSGYDYNATLNITTGRINGIIHNNSSFDVTGVKLYVNFYSEDNTKMGETVTLEDKNLSIDAGSSGAFSIPFSVRGEVMLYEATSYDVLYNDDVTSIIIAVVCMIIAVLIAVLAIFIGRVKKTYQYNGNTIEVIARSRRSELRVNGKVVDQDPSLAIVNLRMEGEVNGMRIVAKIGMGFFRARVTLTVNGQVLTPIKKNKNGSSGPSAGGNGINSAATPPAGSDNRSGEDHLWD